MKGFELPSYISASSPRLTWRNSLATSLAKGIRPRRLLSAILGMDATPSPMSPILEKTMISADLLRQIRNDLPMSVTIANLGRAGPPSKMSEGYYRFLCPRCGEMRATVNPRNNLAHCFCCQKNLNNIDLLITLGYDFLSAVALLEGWLKQYQAQQAKSK
jgi:hypothetical protein